jgi:lambda repressor-like predicted transcriptional regulator
VDGSGNVIVTGHFAGTVDFGGGPVTSSHFSWLNENDYFDIFLAKYSASGAHVWSKHFGDVANDYGRGVAVDNGNNVIVTGSCTNYVDFGDGNLTQTFGSDDIFIAKYSGMDGSRIWSKRVGGMYEDYGYGIAVDNTGDVIVTGQFMAEVDFGGGRLSSAGGGDIFVAKFSRTDGGHIWSKRFGSISTDYGYRVAVDSSRNVYVIGRFVGTVDFGGGPLTSAGGYDIFVAKFSGTDGGHIWSKRFGSAGYDYANGIAVDSGGNVLVTGQFQGIVDFGGGPLTSAGGYDIFMAKYNGVNGSHIWSKRFGSTSSDYGNGIAVDEVGNVIMTGAFYGTVDFGGGSLTASGIDIVVAKYTSSGGHMWSEKFGGTINQFGSDVAVNGGSNIAVTGYFENIVDFGYGTTHTSAGAYDIFLVTLVP